MIALARTATGKPHPIHGLYLQRVIRQARIAAVRRLKSSCWPTQESDTFHTQRRAKHSEQLAIKISPHQGAIEKTLFAAAGGQLLRNTTFLYIDSLNGDRRASINPLAAVPFSTSTGNAVIDSIPEFRKADNAWQMIKGATAVNKMLNVRGKLAFVALQDAYDEAPKWATKQILQRLGGKAEGLNRLQLARECLLYVTCRLGGLDTPQKRASARTVIGNLLLEAKTYKHIATEIDWDRVSGAHSSKGKGRGVDPGNGMGTVSVFDLPVLPNLGLHLGQANQFDADSGASATLSSPEPQGS